MAKNCQGIGFSVHVLCERKHLLTEAIFHTDDLLVRHLENLSRYPILHYSFSLTLNIEAYDVLLSLHGNNKYDLMINTTLKQGKHAETMGPLGHVLDAGIRCFWSNKGRNKVEQLCKGWKLLHKHWQNILALRNILCSIWMTPWIISMSHTMDYLGGLSCNWSLNEKV